MHFITPAMEYNKSLSVMPEYIVISILKTLDYISKLLRASGVFTGRKTSGFKIPYGEKHHTGAVLKLLTL